MELGNSTTYLEIPPKYTMLLARQMPETGGDTLFANQYLAYEASIAIPIASRDELLIASLPADLEPRVQIRDRQAQRDDHQPYAGRYSVSGGKGRR